MKILVPTKRVPDTDQKIVPSHDGSQVNIEHIPWILNPYDGVALEEAVRIREQQSEPVEVVAVGIGGDGYDAQLRTALAVGASRAIHVHCDGILDSWIVARLLHAVVVREQPGLVIMGRQAVDDDANQTGQFLAALLNWPQATFASRIQFDAAEVIVDREVDEGVETLRLSLPAVVTVNMCLNEPRYASLAGIREARKKPLEVLTNDDLGVALDNRTRVVRYRSAETRSRGERLSSVDDLIDRLSRPGGVLHNRN